MSSPWTDQGGSGQGSWGPGGGEPVDPYAGQAAPPVPAYHPYVNPGSWEPAQYLPKQSVPGTILAGSIVGYVFSLLLFVSGLFLVFFGTVIPDSFDELDSTLGDGGASLVVAGLGNWLAVALLVTAGVMCSVRRSAGAVVMVAAAVLVLVLAISWVVLYPDGGVVFWAVVHAAFALVAAGLVIVSPRNRAWLAGAPGSGPPPPSGPAPYPTDAYGRPFGS